MCPPPRELLKGLVPEARHRACSVREPRPPHRAKVIGSSKRGLKRFCTRCHRVGFGRSFLKQGCRVRQGSRFDLAHFQKQGHRLFACTVIGSGGHLPLIYCRKCGRYAHERAHMLRQACIPLASGQRGRLFSRILCGRHPTTVARLAEHKLVPDRQQHSFRPDRVHCMLSRPLHGNGNHLLHVHGGQSSTGDDNYLDNAVLSSDVQLHVEHSQSSSAPCSGTHLAHSTEHAQRSTSALDFDFRFGLRPGPPMLAQGGLASNGLRPSPPVVAQGGCASRNLGFDDPEGDLWSDSD